MGIDLPSVQLLCCAKQMGVDFSETVTIGRQTFASNPDIASEILSQIRLPKLDLKEGQFSEPFFKLLGASGVSSIDASDFEQATIVHDLNTPLPAHLSQRFSAVHDGGSIEHVFNAPQAFKSCMEMVRLGGHFIQVNCGNNYMGHGLWQFSPELMFRMFSPENGFLIKAVLLHSPTGMNNMGTQLGKWYFVTDPAQCRSRVELINDVPTYICTIAQRVTAADIFAKPPMQSDYVASWSGNKAAPQKAPRSFRDIIPGPVKRVARFAINSLRPKPDPFDKPYYKYVPDHDLVAGIF
jgi:hypothetical protein